MEKRRVRKFSQNSADTVALTEDAETSFVDAGCENAQIQIWGFKKSPAKIMLNWLATFFTLGILRLLLHWKPTWRVTLTCHGCPLKDADLILIRDENYEWFLRPVKNIVRPDESLSLLRAAGEVRIIRSLRYFAHRKLCYVWYAEHGRFTRLKNADYKVKCGDYHKFAVLDNSEAHRRFFVYGLNEIVVQLKPILHLVFREALNPFYVFQVFSISVWYSDNYFYYASVIVFMSVMSIAVDVYQIRKNQRALRDTISSSGTVTLLRRRDKLKSSLLGNEEKNVQSAAHKKASDGCGGEEGADDDDDVEALTLPSTSLVPGDVFVLPSRGCVMQCDAVLLTGNCIVNESMLTGESVPVTKIPLPKRETAEGCAVYNDKHHAKHTLYNGTKVLQTRYYAGQQVRAVVIRTGYNTLKGQLVRSIMYPKPVDFEFTKDLLRFVGVLACIAAVGFLYTIILMSLNGVGLGKIVTRALDIITIVVPPALPAAMTIGVMAAEQRLKRCNVYCISPTTINTCGGLNVVCFDKTGTLTEEGLDLLGVLQCNQNSLNVETSSVRDLGNDHPLTQSMACCHSLTRIDHQLTGDPLDLVLFRETGWLLEEPEIVEETGRYDMLAPTVVRPGPCSSASWGDRAAAYDSDVSSTSSLFFGSTKSLEIGILRQLPFSSTLQRMSVVARLFGSLQLTLFCKGAPETVASLCAPHTVPKDFHCILQKYTQRGYRVIAAASRPLDMSYVKAQRASRDQLENSLKFCGLIVLENRLKAETTPVIGQLRRAQIRSVMVTGDNILTAISVARDCGILFLERQLYVVEVTEQNIPKISNAPPKTAAKLPPPNENECYTVLPSDLSKSVNEPSDFIEYRESDDETLPKPSICVKRDDINVASATAFSSRNLSKVNDVTSPLLNNCKEKFSSIERSEEDYVEKMEKALAMGYQLAIAGPSFALLLKHYPQLTPKLVAVCDVFARMAPEQKAQLIHCLQELNYVVAMCGDGANDCGALKAAHAGISLSEAEASIASPFTSKTPNVQCVLDVIREGRAALVTSFGIFKYMAGYSMTQFISVSILYWIGTNLADFQFLYIDLCLITVFAVFFGYTPASQQLDAKPPPTKILSTASVASICLQLTISASFQIFAFLLVAQQPWFMPFVDPGDEQNFDSFQCTAIFLTSINQYVTLAVVYSKSFPYRKSLFTNRCLFASLLICTAVNLTIILVPPDFLASWLNLKIFPYFRYKLFLVFVAALNFLLAIFAEKFVIEFVLAKYLAKKAYWKSDVILPKYVEILASIGHSLSWLLSSMPTDVAVKSQSSCSATSKSAYCLFSNVGKGSVHNLAQTTKM